MYEKMLLFSQSKYLRMQNFLYSLLVDPETGNELTFDPSANTLMENIHQKSFNIIEQVPILLEYESNSPLNQTKIHNDFNSDFKYQAHYQEDARVFDYFNVDHPIITNEENQKLHNNILKAIPKASTIILDVGCGNAWVSKALIPKGKKVISMDISTINPVNAIKKIAHENHAGLVADAFRIPIRKGTIDCVIASEIIEHVTDPKAFISNLILLLVPGGKLIITTPYNEKIVYSLCVHCNKPTPHSAHIHSFNENNLKEFIPNQGIKYSFKKLNNLYLIKTRIHYILKIFPGFIWNFLDYFMNRLTNKALRLMIEIEKP